MMNQTVQGAINRQINAEMGASYSYLAMSAWCERNNFTGSARWLRAQSQEEHGHAMRLFDFMLARNAKPDLLKLDQPRCDYKSLTEVFETAYEQEKSVSAQIDSLYEDPGPSANLAPHLGKRKTPLLLFHPPQLVDDPGVDEHVIVGSLAAGIIREDAQRHAHLIAGQSHPAMGAHQLKHFRRQVLHPRIQLFDPLGLLAQHRIGILHQRQFVDPFNRQHPSDPKSKVQEFRASRSF